MASIGVRRSHRAGALDQLGLERRAAAGAGRGLFRQAHDLERAGPVRQAAQEAPLLEGGDQPVDAGLGGQVQGFLHLVEGRRDPGFLDPLMDEHEQFVLFAREHRQALGTNQKRLGMFSRCSCRMSSKPAHRR
jgi:hypothetical protein